ncbi:MAG: HlyD family efflux transporter periplasmic adaptor subunit [Caldilineaceae bacterium]
MTKFNKWTGAVLIALGIGAGGYLVATGRIDLRPATAQAQSTNAAVSTVQIQSAANVIGKVSASGKIGLVATNYVVMDVSGTVRQVAVHAGDVVKAGDTLLTLDSTELERAARRAQLSVDAAKNSLAQLQKPASDMEIAAALADLLSAQQKLADAQKPASETEISAAKANVTSAWAKYNELLAPKSQAEITKLEASLRQAEVTMAEKQRAYDQIKWRNDVGMTPEAAALQQATIAYESAKADYEVSTKAADTSTVQSALSSARTAEQQLSDLQAKPDKASIASAQSAVATAQQKLDDLKQGSDSLALEADQIKLDQALVDLEEAYSNLAKAKLTAPVSGVVLSIDAESGQRLASGASVAQIADLNALQLTVDVAEVDIDQIKTGQKAEVTVDALAGKSYDGTVERIAPLSSSNSGVVNYQVTILLDKAQLNGVRPDMTAVAKLVKDTTVSGWLVPTTAITQNNGQATVTVVRNGAQQQVVVTPGEVQGEWTVVQAPELQNGDSVVGTVTTYTNDSNSAGFGPGRGGPPGGGRGG